LTDHQKRKGDISCETSPSLSDLSKIWYGTQIATAWIPSLFRSCERSPHFPHFSDICVARVSSLPSFQLPGMSSVAGSLQCLWSALFFWKIALPLKK
jgi:hypothetical protein